MKQFTSAIIIFLTTLTSFCQSEKSLNYIKLFAKVNDFNDSLKTSKLFTNPSFFIQKTKLLNVKPENINISKTFIIDAKPLNQIFSVHILVNNIEDSTIILKNLRESALFDYVEVEPEYTFFHTPNDLHSSQWNLLKVNAEDAWNISKGDKGIVVAIVDDAVDTTHPDLRPQIWRNKGEIPGNGIDDDNNGYIDDYYGWDAADNDNNPNPPVFNSSFTHGTHCAGIAGAATNNNSGIASLAYNITLMPVKIGASATGGLRNSYKGVEYAIINKARIVSMSWGGSGYSYTNQLLFDYGNQQGIIFVAAAGNSKTNAIFYPAGYNHVISVGASDPQDKKASFSNFGTWVKVFAPGTNIYSTITHGSKYGNLSGTSMACPLVSSLCALMLSYNPHLTPTQLKNCLYASCDNIDALNPGFSGQMGAGRINALKALNCLKPIVAFFGSNKSQTCPGDTVTYSCGPYSGTVTYQWLFQGGTPSSSTVPNPKVVYASVGSYDVRLIVTKSGFSDTLLVKKYIKIEIPKASVDGTIYALKNAHSAVNIELTGIPPFNLKLKINSDTVDINNINANIYTHYLIADTVKHVSILNINDFYCNGTFSGKATIIPIVDTSNCLNVVKFQKYFNRTGNEIAHCVKEDNNGNFYVSGYTTSYSSNNDGFIAKFNSGGQQLWIRTIGGSQNDMIYKHFITSDNHLICVGETFSTGFGAKDVLISKLDSNGNTIWNKIYGSSVSEFASDVFESDDGNYIIGIAAQTNSVPNKSEEIVILKLDKSGNEIWKRVYGDNDNNRFMSFTKLSNGNIGIVSYGHVASVFKTNYSELNQLGNIIYDKYLQHSDNIIPRAIKEFKSGNIYIVGQYKDASNIKAFLLILNSSRNVTSIKTYGGTGTTDAFDIIEDSDGNVVMTGYTNVHKSGSDFDAFLLKTNTTGDVMNFMVYGNNSDEIIYDIINCNDNGHIICGTTKSYNSNTNNKLLLIKTNCNLNSGCDERILQITTTNKSHSFSNSNFTSGSHLNNQNWNTTSNSQLLMNDYKVCTSCNTAIPTLTSNTIYHHANAAEQDHSVIKTKDNYIVTFGTIKNNSSTTRDFYVKKHTIDGNLIWAKRYVGSNDEFGTGLSIKQVSDSGFVFSGCSKSMGNSNGNLVVVRIDKNGGIIWQKKYHIANNKADYGRDIFVDEADNIYVVGTVHSYSNGAYSEQIILKLTPAGAKIFDISIGESSNSIHLLNFIGTKNSSFYATGHGSSGSSYVLSLVKSTINGSFIWSKNISAPTTSTNAAYSGVFNKDSTAIILAGYGNYNSVGNFDFLICAVDTNGSVLWTKGYGTIGEDKASHIIKVSDGYLVAGYTKNFDGGKAKRLVIKIDFNGNLIWSKIYGSIGATELTDDFSKIITEIEPGRYALTGWTNLLGTEDGSMIILNNCGETACNYSDVSLTSKTHSFGSNTYSVTPKSHTDQMVNTTFTVSDVAAKDSITCTSKPSIIVKPCQLTASFSEKLKCSGDTSVFTSTSTDGNSNIISWKWLVNDILALQGNSILKYRFTTPGTYNIKLIVGNNNTPACSDTTEKSITITDKLKIELTDSLTICKNDSTFYQPDNLLCAFGPISYKWTPASGLRADNLPQLIASPPTSRYYYLTVTDQFNNKSTDSVWVHIDTSCCKAKAGILSNIAAACIGDTIFFTNTSILNAGIGYSWKYGLLPSQTVSIGPAIPYYVSTQPGTYKVTLKVIDNCGADSTELLVPISAAPNSQKVILDACLPDSVYLGDSIRVGQNTYEWLAPPLFTDPNLSYQIPYLTQGDTFRLKIKESFTGCYYTDTFIVKNIKDNKLNIGPDTVICNDQSVTYHSNITGTNYKWHDNSTSNSLQVNYSGIIWLEVTLNGCTSIDSAEVSVLQRPVFQFDPDFVSTCDTNQLEIEVPISGNDFTIKWDDNSNNTKRLITQSGIYHLTLSRGKCIHNDSIELRFLTKPILFIGDDTTICNDQNITFTSNIVADSYKWHDNSVSNSLTVNAAGFVWLEINLDNCITRDSATVTILERPTFAFDPDSILACDTSQWELTVPITGTDFGIQWDDNTNGLTRIVNQSGSYNLTLSRGHCTYLDSIQVNFQEKPFVFLGEDTIICYTDTLFLSAFHPGATYLWQDANTNFLYFATEPGLYKVAVTNECGTYEDEINLETIDCSCELYVPDAFSPNNDNINDRFLHSTCDFNLFKMEIFDRWGAKVFETDNPEIFWDGTLNGKQLPSGGYVWIITMQTKYRNNNQPFKKSGVIFLLR